MKKKVITGFMKSREDFANPYSHLSLNDRLAMSNSVDLRNNFRVEEDGDYLVIKPINPDKRYRK